jgi:serine/threonine protein phosphatase PrpC
VPVTAQGIAFATRSASSRASTEDRLHVQELARGVVIVVADGAGGMAGAARAAELVIEEMRRAVSEPAFDAASERAWIDRLVAADAGIADDPGAGETTGIALVVADDWVLGASVGDSEAWIVRGRDYDVLTAAQGRGRLGTGRAAPVAFTRELGGGTLVVGTDGLFAYAAAGIVCKAATLGGVEGAADALIERVRLPSGRYADDLAVVVARRTTR